MCTCCFRSCASCLCYDKQIATPFSTLSHVSSSSATNIPQAQCQVKQTGKCGELRLELCERFVSANVAQETCLSFCLRYTRIHQRCGR